MYKNPHTGTYELPWVRLHATKDYYDTAAILDEFPQIRSNFNLVPSLLAQLDEYAQGAARDRYMDLTLKPAEELSEDERIFILHNFFMANWETMVYPYPRYLQLLEKRGRQTSAEELRRIQTYFKPQDLRDLQVWFNLSWMDPYWQEHDELVKALFAKGKLFSENDKQALVRKQLEICGLIVEKYRRLQERGQIEVTTTPFYHPILPLLCNTNNARGSTPQINLPRKRFQHPEDARTQIQKAVDYYARCFGKPPSGMWPSEGSVAEDVLPLFAENGISWIATDEEILFRSEPHLGASRRSLYRPYQLRRPGGTVNIVFRDHALSDAIGFVYTKWNYRDAVADFMKRIHFIGNMMEDEAGQCLVTVILDGENCWEYYANDGWDFLRLLYQTLSEDPRIETVTIGDYLKRFPPQDTIKNLWPGSWINGNYGIWIGHPEDNLAWDYLNDARSFLSDYAAQHPEKKDLPALKAAWERIYIAEGSDWNWWYGDDHSSGNDEMFDLLFRQNLMSVYELMGERVPDYLHKAIKGMVRKVPTLEPIDFISPVIDGRMTNYFEWKPAGFYQVGHSGGSMHQVETVLKSFYYGFDLNNLYFRFDIATDIQGKAIEDLSFKIIFLAPQKREILLSLATGGAIRQFILSGEGQQEPLTTAAAKKIIEMAVPLESLRFPAGYESIEFVVLVLKNGNEIERWPYQSSVIIPRPSEDFALRTWSV
jgi:alpha-amylase/alpha-mannosidase (GH57 family)